MKFILARKINMTQVFLEDGRVVPVTALEVLNCKVAEIKNLEKSGYAAVKVTSGKISREFRGDGKDYHLGQEIKAADFIPGEIIDVIGTSKGRGMAGAVKRHGFHGAPASHGHDHPRAVGSIGMRFPQHVRPGLRMAGHMGSSGATVKHSMIVGIDPLKNLLFVKGGVPGAPKNLLRIVATGVKKDISKAIEYGTREAEPEKTAPVAEEKPQESK